MVYLVLPHPTSQDWYEEQINLKIVRDMAKYEELFTSVDIDTSLNYISALKISGEYSDPFL